MLVDENLPALRFLLERDDDLVADSAVDQVGHARQQLVGIDRARQQRLGPGEGEQPASEGGGAIGAFHRIVQVARGFLRLQPQLAPRQFQPADDHRQHIVEVMRDAAGQLADRVHLLHLAQIVLGGGALGRFALQLVIGVGQFGGAGAHGGVEPVGALRLQLRLAPGVAPVIQGDMGEPGREQNADQQHQTEQAPGPPDPFAAVAGARHRQAAFAQPRIFRLYHAVEQRGDAFEVLALAGLMEFGERRHLLVVGGAQPDLTQRLAALFKRVLQRLDIAALPAGAARGIVERLELAAGVAPLVLEQAAGVRLQADDIAGQRHFGASDARFEAAGERDDLETALLFRQRAGMIARGVAGGVEQCAERTDQQDDEQPGHGPAQRGGPPAAAPLRLLVLKIAVRH